MNLLEHRAVCGKRFISLELEYWTTRVVTESSLTSSLPPLESNTTAYL